MLAACRIDRPVMRAANFLVHMVVVAPVFCIPMHSIDGHVVPLIPDYQMALGRLKLNPKPLVKPTAQRIEIKSQLIFQ